MEVTWFGDSRSGVGHWPSGVNLNVLCKKRLALPLRSAPVPSPINKKYQLFS